MRRVSLSSAVERFADDQNQNGILEESKEPYSTVGITMTEACGFL